MIRYRIVRDNYMGYEAQYWRPWWPFWVMVGGCNTHSSIDSARRYIDKWRDQVVWTDRDKAA